MTRKRVSKGSVIPRKEFKLANVMLLLPDNCNFDLFFEEFKKTYPKDWDRVNKRYQEHERLTKPGKSHPMAHPVSYMQTAFKSFQKKLAKENMSAAEFLASLKKENDKESD